MRRSAPNLSVLSIVTSAMVLCGCATAQTLAPQASAAQVTATRIGNAPLITVDSSATLGGNVNGPSMVRVPAWVHHPLGKYYLYFANHKGRNIELAYSNAVTGPWKIYEPGVLNVSATAFYRPQPDPPQAVIYTHVASPDVFIDAPNKRLVMWAHGFWTDLQPTPPNLNMGQTVAWGKAHKYEQKGQGFTSTDGLHWTALPEISDLPYLRVFQYGGKFYAVGRTGKALMAPALTGVYALGPDLFRNTKYKGRVRHVALLVRGSMLYVFFTAIGDAPEHVLVSTVDLSKDYKDWSAGEPVDVLKPEASYECPTLPKIESDIGDVEVPVNQIRDPGIFEDSGKVYLLYSTCGEQGIALAELHFAK